MAVEIGEEKKKNRYVARNKPASIDFSNNYAANIVVFKKTNIFAAVCNVSLYLQVAISKALLG